MKVEQVIIIGAGPAGLATAIQLKRYGVQPVLFERAELGGLLLNANLVENYPGFPGGISGPELVDLFLRQAQSLNIRVTREAVLNVTYARGIFSAETERTQYGSKILVVATGTKPLHLKGLVIPDELAGRVYYEVYPLLHLEGQCVAIVGSGDAAFDYALNLGKKNQVLILNRGPQPKCLPLLWERSKNTSSITYHDNILICGIRGNPEGGLSLDCQGGKGEIQFQVDYLLGATGREAQLDCLSEAFRRQEARLVNDGVLYLIGDVKNGIYRQTSIAVGEGVMAAMKIYRHLREAIE